MKSFLLTLLLLAAVACAKGQQANPLPDSGTLIRQVKAHQQQVEQIRRNYICILDHEVQHLDKNNQVKDTEKEKYELYFLNGYPVHRLISKEGRPLNEDEKNDAEKSVLKQEKRARKLQEKPDEEDDYSVSISTFLESSIFKNIHREQYKEREVIAMDFEPNPAFKPHNRSETLASKLGGKVWIDENDLQVTRLEAHLVSSMRVMGPLASIKEGTAVIMEQGRINDEIWLPSFTDANFGARLFFKGINAHVIDHYSNYRKFKTSSKIVGVGQPQ
jgi:hypothetical protein